MGSDEPSDFLARERAALGDDAQQFTTAADNSATVADVDDDDDDLLGGGGPAATNGASSLGNDMGDFESSFPAVDTQNEGVAPGGTITGSTAPFQAPDASAYENEEEPEVLREWRERRDLQIQRRFALCDRRRCVTLEDLAGVHTLVERRDLAAILSYVVLWRQRRQGQQWCDN